VSTRRLFFALWPDAAMRDALAAATRGVVRSARGGRAVPVDNLHVTLAFLGAVPEPSLAAVRVLARVASVQCDPATVPLHVRLDAIDYWRHARILCATATSGAPGAASLAGALKAALAAAGFHPDLEPFRAHVTLARQVKSARVEAGMAPVTWTFGAFALIESRTGAEGSSYSIVESWTLCGPARSPR
jgi:2'-5' RNA ligase